MSLPSERKEEVVFVTVNSLLVVVETRWQCRSYVNSVNAVQLGNSVGISDNIVLLFGMVMAGYC